MPRVISIGSSVVDETLVKGEASVTRDTARLPNASPKDDVKSFTPKRALEKAMDHALYSSYPE